MDVSMSCTVPTQQARRKCKYRSVENRGMGCKGVYTHINEQKSPNQKTVTCTSDYRRGFDW
jgi:hypothetical protein